MVITLFSLLVTGKIKPMILLNIMLLSYKKEIIMSIFARKHVKICRKNIENSFYNAIITK